MSDLWGSVGSMGLFDIKIQTHGSIGVEGHFTAEYIKNADAIVIGKPLVATGVGEAIKSPKELISKALNAATFTQAAYQEDADAEETSTPGIGITLYTALMNGVSHMIPFAVTGGLLLALLLSIGVVPSAEILGTSEDSPVAFHLQNR